MSATAAPNYHFSGYGDSQNSLTNTISTVTGRYNWSPTVVANPTYTVTCASDLIGISNAYLSTSSTATSGSSSLSVPYDTTVYGFAVLDSFVYPGKLSSYG